MLRRSVLSLLALVAVAGGASAQPALGPEFQVNTHTTAHQEYPVIAADANGNFVVVWNSDQQDGAAFGVFGQRFDRLGNPIASEFAVNTITTDYQIGPSVAAHPSGSFVVVWSDGNLSGDYTEIFARRYDSSGSPLGAEFQVNTLIPGFQYNPDVAITPAGDFVVVWQSQGKDGDGYAVIGRRFDAAGNPLTPEFQLNAYTTSDQALPVVATTPTGEVVVAWVSDTQDGDGIGVFVRRFDTSGSPLGPEVRVNTYTASGQDFPDIAMDASGNFVVVWESRYQDGSNWGIFGQRFDPTVNPVGLEFRVNTYTTNRQARPSVAREADGHFVVTWQSANQISATGDDVFAQRFDPAGAKVGPEFQVNTYTTNVQRAPAVASLGEEKFVVAWTSRNAQDGDGDGIFAQRFGDLIFRDGFESGDLSGWSSANTDGGDLSVTPGAALNGSNFGLAAFADDTNAVYVQDDTPNDEGLYRARFYFDPNDFDPGESLDHRRTRMFVGFAESPTRRLMAIVLRRIGGAYAVMGRARRDDNSQADTGFFAITAVPHVLEVRWVRASAPGANDGLFELWIDETLTATLTNVDNDTAAVDFVRMGGLSIKTGAAGTMRFDEFESRRETHIGP